MKHNPTVGEKLYIYTPCYDMWVSDVRRPYTVESVSGNCHGKGKWFYHLVDAEKCEPYSLPASAIRHGRSWCEF